MNKLGRVVFLCFYFVWTICSMLHKAIGIWSHDHSEFALHVLTDCSVSCHSKRLSVRYPAQNVSLIVCGISLLVVL